MNEIPIGIQQQVPSKSLSIFLGVMSLLFFLSPFAREFGMDNLFFKTIFCAVCVTCIYLVALKSTQTIIAILLTLPGIVMTLSLDSFEYSFKEIIGLISNMLLFIFIIYVIARHIKGQRRVNQHIISGAICIYLLLGLVWSFIYMLIELLQPGSFNGIYSNDTIDAHSISQVFNHLFYYSYVTLTTLGFGSISPRTVIASAFSSAEAIFGQLYVAIVIARLVSLYTTQEIQKMREE